MQDPADWTNRAGIASQDLDGCLPADHGADLAARLAAAEEAEVAQRVHALQLQERIAELEGQIRQLHSQLEAQEATFVEQIQEKARREEAQAAALEQSHADTEDLRARLTALCDTEALESQGALIDSRACASEALEELQQEHEQEINR